MPLFKSPEARELDELNKVENSIKCRQRCERFHHILIAGLAVLLAASTVLHIVRKK